MKKSIILIGAPVVALLCVGYVITLVLGGLFKSAESPQPKFGFGGQWRRYCQFGWKEAPLPPASKIWNHYEGWKAPSNDLSRRFYIARLGHAERQSNFRASTNMTSGMPLGDYCYTSVEFDYTDPTNGVYHLSWSLRGKHDVGFLRFDDTERLYELELQNTSGEFPPKLSIEAIEGIEPWGN